MQNRKQVTVSLGKLAVPLAKFCKTHQQTQSEAIRTAIAKLLKVEVPAIEIGNPDWIAMRGTGKQQD